MNIQQIEPRGLAKDSERPDNVKTSAGGFVPGSEIVDDDLFRSQFFGQVNCFAFPRIKVDCRSIERAGYLANR